MAGDGRCGGGGNPRRLYCRPVARADAHAPATRCERSSRCRDLYSGCYHRDYCCRASVHPPCAAGDDAYDRPADEHAGYSDAGRHVPWSSTRRGDDANRQRCEADRRKLSRFTSDQR